MKRLNQTGFTTIELVIVLIVVIILGALVFVTHGGVQATNRDTQRRQQITKLQGELEIYYAKETAYPSLKQLNDASWREKNLKDVSADDFTDPQWDGKLSACIRGDHPIFASGPAKKCIGYQPVATDGSNCDAEDVVCAQYTLTATLENGKRYVKNSLN